MTVVKAAAAADAKLYMGLLITVEPRRTDERAGGRGRMQVSTMAVSALVATHARVEGG